MNKNPNSETEKTVEKPKNFLERKLNSYCVKYPKQILIAMIVCVIFSLAYLIYQKIHYKPKNLNLNNVNPFSSTNKGSIIADFNKLVEMKERAKELKEIYLKIDTILSKKKLSKEDSTFLIRIAKIIKQQNEKNKF